VGNRPRDPCAGCGEETATGSLRFSSRRAIPTSGDRPDYLCEFCEALAAAPRHGRLSDEELRALIDNGSMAAIAWANAGTPGA
jgi:hypothetical protein